MSHAPRVLVSGVVLDQPMGGVRRHNAELLPRVDALLRADGGGVAVLEGLAPVAFELPPEIERFPSRVPPRPVAARAATESRALRAALESAARAGRAFDLVHTGHLPTPRGLGVPFTWTVHDLRSLDLDRAPFARRILAARVVGRAMASARRVLCPSEAMRARIESEFAHVAGRVDVVGNGADHLPVVARDTADPPFLVHVGHVEPRKNLDLLIRALAADPHLPRVVLAGAPKGDALERLLALATDLGVAGRLEVVTDADDGAVAQLYASAACAVFPSRLEGFGIGPAEALRARCPVAVSDIAAHVECTGGVAPTFPVDDPAALVRAVRAAMAKDAPRGPDHRWGDQAERWVASLRRAAGLGR